MKYHNFKRWSHHDFFMQLILINQQKSNTVCIPLLLTDFSFWKILFWWNENWKWKISYLRKRILLIKLKILFFSLNKQWLCWSPVNPKYKNMKRNGWRFRKHVSPQGKYVTKAINRTLHINWLAIGLIS